MPEDSILHRHCCENFISQQSLSSVLHSWLSCPPSSCLCL